MARLAFLFTVLLLLFTFSHARFITAEPDPDVNPDETHTDLPESTATILLPSQIPESETDSGVGSVPLTKILFHPVNRRFPRRPLFPFRQKHNCRFHKRFHKKRFISYGNDMILSDGRSFDPESRGVVPQIEAGWGSFHDDGSEFKQHLDHHHHEHEHEHEHEHHDHDHDHKYEDEHDHEDNHHHHRYHHKHHHKHGEDEEHEGGFMEKFRRFFIHF